MSCRPPGRLSLTGDRRRPATRSYITSGLFIVSGVRLIRSRGQPHALIGGERFDDPLKQYRVLYAAAQRAGLFCRDARGIPPVTRESRGRTRGRLRD